MRRILLMLLLLSGTSAQVWAACTASLSNNSPSFGTSVTSFTLNSAEQPVSTNIYLDCDSALSLLTNDYATLTMTGASTLVASRGAMKRTDDLTVTDTIPVKLCGVSGCSSGDVTNGGAGYTWNGTFLLTVLGSKRYTLPLFLRTVTGQSVSAGPYAGTLNLNLYYNICAVGTILTGCTQLQSGNLALNLTVSMTVTNDCTAISAPNVNFGSAPIAKAFPAISQSISVTCTKGYAYTIGINNGNNANGTVRQMANGSNRLSYEIYKGSTSSRWGAAGAERWSSGTSSSISTDGTLRTYNYTAQVMPNQTTPPGGTYSDTLLIDLAF